VGLAVVRSVSVHATAAEVFDAFTRVSELLSWLCEGALVGLRPGGNWAVGFTDARGMTEATILGKIAEFEHNRRLVVEDISYEPAAGEALSGIRLELTIAERENGCLVTVAQDIPDGGLAYTVYRGEAEAGWESSLGELKKYLEGPRRRRIAIEAGLPTN
jgi:uncharacterized protein YndB with AHSA1/START domain